MFITCNSCPYGPTPSSATNYRWRIEVAICTAGQSVRSVLLAFAFMESLRIYGFRPILQPVRGAIVSSEAYRRERSSIRKASRLQMVTLSQPATLLALASTWPTLASTEAFTHRGTSTCLPACPVSTLIQHLTKCGDSGAQEPRATMSYPSSNLHRQPSNARAFLVVLHVIYLRPQRCYSCPAAEQSR